MDEIKEKIITEQEKNNRICEHFIKLHHHLLI